jgi:hypothetical protein
MTRVMMDESGASVVMNRDNPIYSTKSTLQCYSSHNRTHVGSSGIRQRGDEKPATDRLEQDTFHCGRWIHALSNSTLIYRFTVINTL